MSHRLIIFGGTFDPIHTAHLVLAECAADEWGAEKVLFVPAGDPPHKVGKRVTSGKDRLAMVRGAIDGNPRFELTTIELERPGRSYAIDTITQIKDQYGHAETPGYLIGSDSLLDLPIWKEPDKILNETDVLVVPRPGFDPAEGNSLYRGRFRLLDSPRFALSATEIRVRVQRGESIRYLVPETARKYIQEKGLYQQTCGKDTIHGP